MHKTTHMDNIYSLIALHCDQLQNFVTIEMKSYLIE